MTITFKTFGKILLGTVLSAALILPTTIMASPQAHAATTSTTFKATSTNNAAAIKKGEAIVADAKKYIGKVKYVWGKKDASRLMFDCSSFTQYIYAKNGLKIKWGANSAFKQGTPIKKSNLRVGDLVNVSLKNHGSNIGHVGIYIGNGQMIHNAPGKGVSIVSLNTGYWSTRFVSGARYF